MGYLVGSFCYGTLNEASDAVLSSAPPSMTAGAVGYVQYFEKVSGVWQVKRLSLASDGTPSAYPSTVMPSLSLPSCSVMDNFSDGMLLGWGVAGAMLLVYAVKFIAKGLLNEPTL